MRRRSAISSASKAKEHLLWELQEDPSNVHVLEKHKNFYLKKRSNHKRQKIQSSQKWLKEGDCALSLFYKAIKDKQNNDGIAFI